MDLNYALLWFTGVSGVLGMIRVLQSHSRQKSGWITVFSLVLLFLVTGIFLFPDSAGYVSFAFWFVFFLLPTLLYRRVMNDLFRQQFTRARKLGQWIRFLHPADGFQHYPELLKTFELAQQNRHDEALQILDKYKDSAGWLGDSARIYLMRMHHDWNGILEWSDKVPEAYMVRSSDMFTMYLRALGEVGRTNEMVEKFGQHRKALHKYQKNLRDLARMYVFAFSGRPETVRGLFEGNLHLYPTDTREFWIATAELAAGREQGRARLEALMPSADGLTRSGLELRLRQPLPNASIELIPPGKAILDEEEVAIAQEERYDAGARSKHRAVATYVLLLLNALVFLLEGLLGGTTDLRTLVRLGAVWPAFVLSGEWWRIIAAQFLHYGYVHLGMNLLALYILGPFVERHLGWIRYLLVYIASGAAAMMTIILIASSGHAPQQLVVGASGSIFALVGATGAILMKAWFREKAHVARRRLLSILAVIALQTLFDLTTPQVSSTAHLSGAFYGFLLGWLLAD